MAVFHIVLGNLPFVDLHLLLEEIYRKFFLKQGRALVFFILQNTLHRLPHPGFLSRRSRDTLLRQVFGYGVGGLALNEHPVNGSNGFRFLRHDLRQTVGPLAVTKELAVGNADLAVGKTFPLTPCNIFRNGSAFFLCKGGHNCNE